MPRSNFGGKKLFLQNFIFFHPFESINFQTAGLLKIALIVTPLIKAYKKLRILKDYYENIPNFEFLLYLTKKILQWERNKPLDTTNKIFTKMRHFQKKIFIP